MGVTVRPMGKLKSDFKRIDIENERKKKTVRKETKGKNKK